MTDGELIKVITRIQRMTDEITYLMNEDILNHPNGEVVVGVLHDGGLGYSTDCLEVIHPHLSHPERWIAVAGGHLQSTRKHNMLAKEQTK